MARSVSGRQHRAFELAVADVYAGRFLKEMLEDIGLISGEGVLTRYITHPIQYASASRCLRESSRYSVGGSMPGTFRALRVNSGRHLPAHTLEAHSFMSLSLILPPRPPHIASMEGVEG